MTILETGKQLTRVYRVNGPRETGRRALMKIRSLAFGSSFDEVLAIQNLLTSEQ